MGEHKAPEERVWPFHTELEWCLGASSTPKEASLTSLCLEQEKHLSSNIPLILKLQKIPWLLRKAIDASPIHLHITQYTRADPKTHEPRTPLDLVQRTSAGLGVIVDNRVLDWEERMHENYVFGRVITRAMFIAGEEEGRPDVRVCVDGGGRDQEEVARFLRGEVYADGVGTGAGGFLVEAGSGSGGGEESGSGLWVQTLECSEASAWSAETIWGFEMVNGERYLSRVVAVVGKGKYQLGRCVFGLLNRE
ncbi:hypothetical protein BDW62DRAFT_202888 [Aspergillus aurantiobrunneus]